MNFQNPPIPLPTGNIIEPTTTNMKMKNILLTTLVIFGLNTISIAQVPNYVPTNGLVGWWPFTGNANDLSVNNNNGTVNGASLTSDRFSNINSAYNFNGSSAYINLYSTNNILNTINGLQRFSLSYWAFIPTNARGCIWGHWSNNNGGVGVNCGLVDGFNNGVGFSASNYSGCCSFVQSSFTAYNAWSHVVVVFDAAQLLNSNVIKTYVNGQIISYSPGGIANTPLGNGTSLFIGRRNIDNNNFGDYFLGSVDDIGIWNRALTACEINNLYTSSIPIPVSTTTSAATICAGASTTITASGATTYAWMPGNLTGATITVSPIATTTYTVTGTDANGCINTATRIITVNPLPVVTATSTAAAICVGGSVTLTGGGATSYTWSGGVTNGLSFIPTATATYTVTGTNANGCVNTATITVTVNPLPVVTATSTAAAVCAGASVTLTGGGATTYAWSGGVTDAVSFIPTATITYTVTGTNANACVNTATITVTVNPLPVVTATSTSAAVCNGGSVTLTGGGAVTYSWSGGVTNAVSFIPSATTTYTVTGTNSNGCVNTATTTVTVNPLPAVTANSSAASVCAGGSVTLTGGGAATYSWSNNVMNAVSFIPNSTATYTVTGTDANGCMNTAVIMVIVSTLPTVTATSTAAAVCAGASVTLTGGGAATYSWTNNVTDAVSFIPTQTITYTVTGTSSAGCVNTTTITVTVNPLPVVTATSTAAAVCAGSSVILSGGGAATYSWSGGVTNAVSFIPTATTTYTVTGTNSNGCVNTAMITVTVNPLPIVTATSTAAAVCIGGSVTLTGGGAATYSWDNNVIDAVTFVPSATMTYVVTGTHGTSACIAISTLHVELYLNLAPHTVHGVQI